MDENGHTQRPVIMKFQNSGNKEELSRKKTQQSRSQITYFPYTLSQEAPGESAPSKQE